MALCDIIEGNPGMVCPSFCLLVCCCFFYSTFVSVYLALQALCLMVSAPPVPGGNVSKRCPQCAPHARTTQAVRLVCGAQNVPLWASIFVRTGAMVSKAWQECVWAVLVTQCSFCVQGGVGSRGVAQLVGCTTRDPVDTLMPARPE